MEELRIKCPSCGIILDVKNSKNEAVKQIVCPGCKKHLAVTFHDESSAAQYVEIKMVQLADGGHKTIIRVLTDDHVVKVNSEQLQKDDEVVLAPGDKLEIDGKEGTFSQEGFVTFRQKTPAPAPSPTPDSTPQQPPETPGIGLTPAEYPKRSSWPLSIFIVAVIVAVFVLWQMFSGSKPDAVSSKQSVDTIKVTPNKEITKKNDDVAKPKKEIKKVESKQDAQSQPAKPSISGMSEYDLERLAMKGDAEAQCQLGKRWVSRHDSINVVKGIKYLKLAAQNGSSEARSTLRTVYAALQQSAANGSTSAANILREQR